MTRAAESVPVALHLRNRPMEEVRSGFDQEEGDGNAPVD